MLCAGETACGCVMKGQASKRTETWVLRKWLWRSRNLLMDSSAEPAFTPAGLARIRAKSFKKVADVESEEFLWNMCLDPVRGSQKWSQSVVPSSFLLCLGGSRKAGAHARIKRVLCS
jgi:hypothetical protein